MRQLLAGFYLLLCIGHLIFELTEDSFENGLEAVITMGITAIGIYLSWIVMTKKFR
jgi:hypothetical protein